MGAEQANWNKPDRRKRRIPLLAYLVAFIVVVIGIGWLGVTMFSGESLGPIRGEVFGRSEPAGPTSDDAAEAVRVLLDAVEADKLTLDLLADPGAPEAIASYRLAIEGLLPFEVVGTAGPVVIDEELPDQAFAPVELSWDLGGGVVWETTGTVNLVVQQDEWKVDLDVSLIADGLNNGDKLVRRRIEPNRGSILDRNSAPLVHQVDVVYVGIQPQRVADLADLTAQLAQILGVDADELAVRVEQASPDAFVEVAVLPRSLYDSVRPQIFPLPGTVFREESEQSVVRPGLARAVLGRSGEVTAEIMEANPGVFQIGDVVGRSGLQFAHNAEMVGRPGVAIDVIRKAPDPATTTTGTGLITTSSLVVGSKDEVEQFAVIEPVHGIDIHTTLDMEMQVAADAAVDTTDLNAALVAIQVSTGEVVAVANGPGSNPNNFAMTGQYPPGSISKIVTGYSLMAGGLKTTDPAPCPRNVTVAGREFGNALDGALGQIDFRTAFAQSCNTSFVNLTTDFADDRLHKAGLEFGLGVEVDLGLPAFFGSVPINNGDVDLAAASFGQGRILMSPLAAAIMASTAADGVYRTPRLVTSPGGETDLVAQPLDPTIAAELKMLMRAVVTEGSGNAVAGVPGEPVHGKTGTAEYGQGVPPPTHAWFVGFQGDIAFAVFVESGRFGGTVAAPIAAEFLTAIGSAN